MAEPKRLSRILAAFVASTVLAGTATGAELKLFAPAGEPPAQATKFLPLLQPFPGEERDGDRRSALVPFEQAAAAMHFAGEDDSTVLTFSLTGAQRAAGGQLQLSYRNAVSVLPDTAVLDVEINGRPAGALTVRSPNGFSPTAVAVPAELLREGRNEARLRVRQHHRVDCSLEATYELWTELDPAASGFLAQRGGGFRTPADLLAVGRGEGGVTDIRLVVPEKAAAAAVNDGLPLVQSLALYLNRPDIAVTVASEPGTGPGVDVYVGAPEAYRAVPAAAAAVAGAPAGLSVGDAAAGRAAVVLSGAARSDLESRLVAAVTGPMRAGFDSGVRAPHFGRIKAEPAGRYTLKDAGYRTQPSAGRVARFHFDMEMPADFYPAEYGAVDFLLKGATAPGLKAGAQLLVRVNGEAVRSYPFRDLRGEEFAGKRLELPLRAFRPGVNSIEIVAELPVEADGVCAPQARDEARPRFILLEESELHVPQLARVGRLPDLAAFAGTAYPFAAGKPFDVFVDNADPRMLGAAMTVLARLSQSARAPLSGEIHVAPPEEGRGRDALVLSVAPAAERVSALKGDRFAALRAAAGGLDPLTTASVAAPAMSAAATVADSRSLLEAFHSSTAVEKGDPTLAEQLSGWAMQASGRFGQWLRYRDGDEGGEAATGALVTLSQSRSPLGSATWTEIRAASPAELQRGVARLTETPTWQALQGATASIGAERFELVTSAPKSRYVHDLSDTGFLNLRRIVAAWFSDNFQFYIVLLVALMGGFALWLGRVVPRMGERTDT